MNKQTHRFLKRKQVKYVLGENYVLTPKQEYRLDKLFEKYGSPKKIEDWLTTVAYFIKGDVCNYVRRLALLKNMPASPNKLSFVLRYGPEVARMRYTEVSEKRTKHFKNKPQHWLDKGYSKEESISKAHAIQVDRNKLACAVTSGSSEYTCRSATYWLKKGLSLEDAQKEVARVQTTNGIEYYVSTGLTLTAAEEKQNIRSNARLATLSTKTQAEKDLISLKKSHTIDGYIACGYSLEDATAKSIAYFKKRKNYSIISQDLFDSIVEQYNLADSKYAIANYEYQINGKCVDFYHPASKTVIEFYGDFWHMNPALYTSQQKCYNKVAEDIWLCDAERISLINSSDKVDNIVIIWESDFRKNPQHCINTLQGYFNK